MNLRANEVTTSNAIGKSPKIGETVAVIDYPDTSAGEITDRLDNNYVLVRWADFPTPRSIAPASFAARKRRNALGA
jgi:hypothetical protein